MSWVEPRNRQLFLKIRTALQEALGRGVLQETDAAKTIDAREISKLTPKEFISLILFTIPFEGTATDWPTDHDISRIRDLFFRLHHFFRAKQAAHYLSFLHKRIIDMTRDEQRKLMGYFELTSDVVDIHSELSRLWSRLAADQTNAGSTGLDFVKAVSEVETLPIDVKFRLFVWEFPHPSAYSDIGAVADRMVDRAVADRVADLLLSPGPRSEGRDFVERVLMHRAHMDDTRSPRNEQPGVSQSSTSFDWSLLARQETNGPTWEENLFWRRLRDRGFDFGWDDSEPRNLAELIFRIAMGDISPPHHYNNRARFSLLRRFLPVDSEIPHVSRTEIKMRRELLLRLIKEAETRLAPQAESEHILFLERLSDLRKAAKSNDLHVLLGAFDSYHQLRSEVEAPPPSTILADLGVEAKDAFSKPILEEILKHPEATALRELIADARSRRAVPIIGFENRGFDRLPGRFLRGKIEFAVDVQLRKPDGSVTKASEFNFYIPTKSQRTVDILGTPEFLNSFETALGKKKLALRERFIELAPTAEETDSRNFLKTVDATIAVLQGTIASVSAIRAGFYPIGKDDASSRALLALPERSGLREFFQGIGALAKSGKRIQVGFKSLGFSSPPTEQMRGVLNLQVHIDLDGQSILDRTIFVLSRSEDLDITLREQASQTAVERMLRSDWPELAREIALRLAISATAGDSVAAPPPSDTCVIQLTTLKRDQAAHSQNAPEVATVH